MRADLPVMAERAPLGDITASSLKENVARFKKEVKNFKERNKIDYSLEFSEDSSLLQLEEAKTA